jgi:hypothetical protein
MRKVVVKPKSSKAKNRLDNQEMPNDKKWVNVDCPLHGTGK